MENKDISYYKTVQIPHLHFTIHFLDLSKLQGVEIRNGGGYTCVMGDFEASVFVDDIDNAVKTREGTIIIAHELVHVIQIICDTFGMKIENEIEHMAYIMHYLLDEILEK